MTPKRIVAAGVLALTGVGVAVPNARFLATGGVSLLGIALGVLGVLLGLALVASGAFLYRSDVSTAHALRVAGWNLLGVAVLGAILALATLYLESLPAFVTATVLGVSAIAHVLIGVADVRRIRAEELARQRERLAVLNRLVRHDLRHEAQLLIGLGAELESTEGDAGDRVIDVAERLSDMHENLGTMQRLMEEPPAPKRIALAPLVEEVANAARSTYPEARIETDVPDVEVAATDDLGLAVEEAIENAIEHDPKPDPSVEIDAEVHDGVVDLRIRDEGPGIPERERAIVTGEREVSQLDHATGLGLWTVRTVLEAFEGSLAFEETGDGSVVRLRLPRA